MWTQTWSIIKSFNRLLFQSLVKKNTSFTSLFHCTELSTFYSPEIKKRIKISPKQGNCTVMMEKGKQDTPTGSKFFFFFPNRKAIVVVSISEMKRKLEPERRGTGAAAVRWRHREIRITLSASLQSNRPGGHSGGRSAGIRSRLCGILYQHILLWTKILTNITWRGWTRGVISHQCCRYGCSQRTWSPS